MKYNVGDKVKVRSDIQLNTQYNGVEAVDNMVAMAGKTVTILEVEPRFCGVPMRGMYQIEEDHPVIHFMWTEDMFEPIKEETDDNVMPELTNGMFGVTNKGGKFVIVGKYVIYQDGKWDFVADFTDPDMMRWYDDDEVIDTLYDCHCFDGMIDDKIIWKRKYNEPTESEEEEEDEEEELSFEDFFRMVKALEKAVEDEL